LSAVNISYRRVRETCQPTLGLDATLPAYLDKNKQWITGTTVEIIKTFFIAGR